jgi:hypothetical protein
MLEYTQINVQKVVILYDNMHNLQSKAIVHGASVVLYFLYCLHIWRGRELMIYFLLLSQTTWQKELKINLTVLSCEVPWTTLERETAKFLRTAGAYIPVHMVSYQTTET